VIEGVGLAKHFETEWFFESFASDLTFIKKPMFGSLAAYLDGKIVAVLSENHMAEVWNGILLPTELQSHTDLLSQYPFLESHKILKKWLFLPATDSHFEERALRLAARIAARDPLFGVVPKAKKEKGASRTRNKRFI
jgi:hypothetical protein